MDVGRHGRRGGHPLLALWQPPPQSPIKAPLGHDGSFINDMWESRAISSVLLWTAASEQSPLLTRNYQLFADVLLEIREESCFPCLGMETKDSGGY